MQDENASRKRAVAAARIAHAAWSGGPHGAAAATAIEAGKHLVRPVLAAVTVIFGLPLLFLAAIPCNLFDAPSVKSADIQEMTAQAQTLNASWKRQRSLEQQAVELFVSLLPKDLGFISVETRLGNTNDYWQIAITSVLHEQDVALLDEDKIVQTMKDKMQYKLEPKYKDGKLVGYILVIYDMTPDELMNKLAFDEQQRDWAALIADTIADSDYAAPVGSSDNTADEDLSDIVFTGRGNSKDVVYFSQYDSRWDSQMYGRTNTIAGAGCGPSSLAICISTLTNKTVTPPEVCEWSVKTGHRCEGSGSYHSLIPDGAAHWGVPCRGIGQSRKLLIQALQDGKLVVAIMSQGHFTRGGHFIVLRGIAQLADIYPRREWEEITACCDATICLGVNDTTSAQFVSEKCGMTTIRVTNNQQPQTPLFSPVANLSRPYSQTRSNTQRALMQPDEVLRLDNAKSIVMLRGQLPMLLYKVMPPEFADFKKLRTLSIAKYHGKTDEVEEELRKTQTKQPKRSAEQAVYANLLHFEKEESCSAPALTAQQLQEIQDALNKGEKDK